MNRRFRQLLIADLALMRGIVTAQDVGVALMRGWKSEGDDRFLRELRRIADLPDGALDEVEAEAERLIAACGGDAEATLMQHGGLDRSIHVALEGEGASVSRALTHLGTSVRAPLRTLATDRYVGFEVAGEGGMGVVYVALDTELNRRVAFKTVKPPASQSPDHATPRSPVEISPPPKGNTEATEAFGELTARFLQEAWVTGGLEHPSIVPVHELGQTSQGIPFYTMRFVRGRRTLSQAIESVRGKPIEERLALLEPFLKLCDAVSYAHSKGVVHRDLKPDNVALGEYGEVILLDWGLAKIEGREDFAKTSWREQIHAFREAADLQTREGAFGTPGYMSPEAAFGQLDEVGPRSDVYSLGAILFEIMTGRLPVPVTTFIEYLTRLRTEQAPTAVSVEPTVPEGLSDLCAKALGSDSQQRPDSVAALASAVRAWQAQTVTDREVEALLGKAQAAVAAGEAASGDGRLRQVELAIGALEQVETRRPNHPTAARYRKRAASLRDQGIREREKASGRRVLVRVGAAVLVAASVASFLVAGAMDSKRKETEQARAEAVSERDAKGRALDDVLRLADSKKVADLAAEADRLWPLEPSKADAMVNWMAAAREVLARRDDHTKRLAEIREGAPPYAEETKANEAEKAKVEGEDAEAQKKALDEQAASLRSNVARLEACLEERMTWTFADPQVDWQHQVLVDVLLGLDRLDGGGKEGQGGLLAEIEQRHGFVTTLQQRSVEDNKEAWDAAIAAIEASPEYAGLKITPQLGLVPLGPDPDSGLFEFAHLGSGSIPTRDDATKRLIQPDDAAIVLVLIPGGTFLMGAQKEDESKPNYDPEAKSDESPVHNVTLTPFFLSKYECTQAQWAAMTGGLDPSNYKASVTLGDKTLTPRNPVERVSWEDCVGEADWLGRNRLGLPSEAQWEYACRAESDTPWVTGREVAKLGTVANVADSYLKANGGEKLNVTPEVDDGHAIHAPVGSFAPNGFGLHDMHGNVFEWCRDDLLGNAYRPDPTTDPLVEGHGHRVARGGSWLRAAARARSAARGGNTSVARGNDLGFRPARSVTP